MAFERMTENVMNISGLPNVVVGQASMLKNTFDKSGKDMKTFINNFLDVLESQIASQSIGASVETVPEKTVQAILTAFESEILNRYTKSETDTLVSTDTNNLIEDFDINLTTGVITITKKDGTTETFDTAIEKVPAKFEIVESDSSVFLKITNVDGTSTQTDITELMNVYEFVNSDDIAFTMTGTGNEKKVTANIRNNSIGIEKFSLSVISQFEGYVTSASNSANEAKGYAQEAKTSKEQAANSASQATNQAISATNSATSATNSAGNASTSASEASTSANLASSKAKTAESYAHGGTGTRQGEDTDNAKYYAQIAKEVAGGDFVTPTEMEAYAQPLGTTPTYETTELSGQEIEVDAPLNMESILHLRGNIEQDSRSGKNLFDMVNGSLSNCTKVIDGNSITLTSTLSTGGFSAYSFVTPAKPNTAYYIKSASTRTGNGGGGIVIQAQKSDGTSLGNIFDKKNTLNAEGKITTTSDTVALKVYLYASGDAGTETSKVSATYTNVQLEEGSTATSYEPYGVKPSPEFESPIMSVKSKSDNLFDSDYSLVTKGGFVKQSDGSYYLNAVKIVNGIWANTENYTGQIAISFEMKWTNYDAYAGEILELEYTDGTKLSIKSQGNSAYRDKWGYSELISDKTKTVKQINLTFGGASQNYFRNVMVAKGSEALPYQPYGYVPAEARAEGKNLVSSTTNEFISSSGVVTTGANDLLSNYIGVENNKSYILSGYTADFTRLERAYQIAFYDDNYNFISRQTGIAHNTPITITNPNVKYIRGWMNRDSSSDVSIAYLQVEKGTMVTPYEPYKLTTVSLPLGDIELRSTPDGTRDTFARVDGVWNTVGKTGPFLLDDTGDIRINENYSTENYNCFYYNRTNGIWVNSGTSGYTEKFEIITDAGKLKTTDKPIMYLGGGTNKQVFIKVKNDITTVDEFKTQIVNNPIEVIVPLATPTYTPITDQALISALDELEQLILHKGYNRITATAVNGVKAYLDLDIPATASVTNVIETDVPHELIIPAVTGEGDVKVKIPAENKMTINPATGEVNVKALKIDGVDIATFIEQVVTKLGT